MTAIRLDMDPVPFLLYWINKYEGGVNREDLKGWQPKKLSVQLIGLNDVGRSATFVFRYFCRREDGLPMLVRVPIEAEKKDHSKALSIVELGQDGVNFFFDKVSEGFPHWIKRGNIILVNTGEIDINIHDH